MKISHPLRRGGPNRCDLRATKLACVVVKLEKNFKKCVDAVRTGENDPVVDMRILHELGELAQIRWRLDTNRGQLKNIGPQRAQLISERAGLLSRACDDNSLPRKRPVFVPI